MPTSRWTAAAPMLAALSVGLTGCSAELGGTGESTLEPPGGSVIQSPGAIALECEGQSEPGVGPLMKLSTLQYRSTVADLLTELGALVLTDSVEPMVSGIPADSTGEIFKGRDNRISAEHIQGYYNVAAAIGDGVAASPELLVTVAGACAESGFDAACARSFLERFLLLAFRRPPTEEAITEYLALNDGVRTPTEAVRAMIVVALSSPRFVYHVEVDGTAATSNESLLAVDPYELASRLSYTFWQSMPDATLFEKAASGELATEAGYVAELERVFNDERSKTRIFDFWREWLLLDKFTGFETGRPAFQALAEGEMIGEEGHDHYGDMVREIEDLTRLFVFDQPKAARDLLTTRVSVTTSPDLARLYGVEPWSGSGPYPEVPEGERAGILQRGALLAANLEQTNPFHRGAVVRRTILCESLPSPDPNTLPPGSLDPPPLDVASTTRQRFSAKVDGNPLCERCHGAFSTLGYVMEAYDSLGRYRTTERIFDEENGALLAELPIDVTGVAAIQSADEAPVTGPLDLNDRIVESGRFEACMAESFLTYVMRRVAEGNNLDSCANADLAVVLADPNSTMHTALSRVARYPSFFQRKVGPR